jgi:hypothetical protein
MNEANRTSWWTLAIGIVVCAAMPASAANTLIGGLITTGMNWDTGLPDTVGNIGIIDSDNTGANEAHLADSIEDLFILQTGGSAIKPSFMINHDFFRSDYEISGGQINTTTGMVFNDNSSFTISGGAVTTSGNLNIKGGSSFAMSGGTLDVINDYAPQGGTHDFSGGIVTIGGSFMRAFNPSGTFNFSGDVTLNVVGQISENENGTRIVNIGLGTGSITAAALEADNMTIDWTSGSLFSLTAATVLDEGAASSWSGLWDAGKLTVDGGQAGTFVDNFKVTGDTLTLATVPEPAAATMGLVVMGGLALLRRYR